MRLFSVKERGTKAPIEFEIESESIQTAIERVKKVFEIDAEHIITHSAEAPNNRGFLISDVKTGAWVIVY